MKRSRIIWCVFGVFSVVLLGCVALTGGIYYQQERNAKDNTSFLALDESKYNITELKAAKNLLSVAIGFVNFEPGKGLDVEIDFVPANNLTDPENPSAPALPVCFTYYDTDVNFTAETSMPTEDVNIGLSGDVNWYPFDRYTGELWFLAQTGQREGQCSDPLPILPAIFGALQGFTVSSSVEPSAVNGVNYSYINIKFTARRTGVSIAFAILLFTVMWCLTASIVLLTAWIWITGRRVELPVLIISTALLYALPNIRNGQPGIPPRAGIIGDLVGYIWNVLLVAVCVVSLIINYIVRKDGKPPKKINKESIIKLGVLNV
jgi:hypothetical protein